MGATEAKIRGDKHYRERHRHPCLDCGKLVQRESTRCRQCNMKELHRLFPTGNHCLVCGKHITRLSHYCRHCCHLGERNPRWRGGIARVQAGYIRILKPEHPRADPQGYVLEHIVVWEAIFGKPLPKDWVIHHLNGIRGDNRSSNLLALPERKHKLILAAKAKRIQELEALLNKQSQLL